MRPPSRPSSRTSCLAAHSVQLFRRLPEAAAVLPYGCLLILTVTAHGVCVDPSSPDATRDRSAML